MNATVHSEISVKNYKGKVDDYYFLHDFCDSSKEVESTNKHRIFFHTIFAVKNFIIPIFGNTIINSDKRKVNVKDLCESDHILPDYKGKFIPTLNDFIDCVSDDINDAKLIEQFKSENKDFFDKYPEINELMMLPFYNTGKIKSLLLTHNSWFIGFVLPKIFKNVKIELKDLSINPSILFSRMEFKPWMQNGNGYPPSYTPKNNELKKAIPSKELIFDGSRPPANWIIPTQEFLSDDKYLINDYYGLKD